MLIVGVTSSTAMANKAAEAGKAGCSDMHHKMEVLDTAPDQLTCSNS